VSEAPGQTASEIVNVGRELRAELERIARGEGRDVTNLARKVLREFVEARERQRRA
jgi:predicted transcriptional regulator